MAGFLSASFTGGDSLSSFMGGMPGRIGTASRRGLDQAAARLVAQARQNASGRPGPNVVSDDLRTSIKAVPASAMGSRARAAVTVGTRYGAAIEGVGKPPPSWPAGIKFPFLGPAAAGLRSGEFRRIMAGAWGSALPKGKR